MAACVGKDRSPLLLCGLIAMSGNADGANDRVASTSDDAEAEAAELAEVVTMILTTSPIPTCPAIDMISITLDSIYRNPQLARIRLLLVCDGCKLLTKDGAKNAYRAGRVTAESLGKYVKYKDNLRREIEAARYP